MEEPGSHNADQDCHSQHRIVSSRKMGDIEEYGVPRNIAFTDVDQFLMSLLQDVEPRVMRNFVLVLFSLFTIARIELKWWLISCS